MAETLRGEQASLSTKIEEAKGKAGRENSAIQGRPARLDGIRRFMDKRSQEQTDHKMRTGELVSLGNYPDGAGRYIPVR
jgi:hypothetical protein